MENYHLQLNTILKQNIKYFPGHFNFNHIIIQTFPNKFYQGRRGLLATPLTRCGDNSLKFCWDVVVAVIMVVVLMLIVMVGVMAVVVW